MTRLRRQPSYILGGSITRAPNGYRAIIQTTMAHAAPMAFQEIYTNALQRRYTPKWDGIVPEGAQVIYLTDPFEIVCGGCGQELGDYTAYWATQRQFGILEHTPRRRHPLGSFPPDNFKN